MADVTGIYEVYEVEKYWVEDVAKFKEFVDKDRTQAAIPMPPAFTKLFDFK